MDGSNYIADDETFPTKVWFANGRKVAIECASPQLEGPQPYLTVVMEHHPAFGERKPEHDTFAHAVAELAKHIGECDDWMDHMHLCQAIRDHMGRFVEQERHQADVYRKRIVELEAELKLRNTSPAVVKSTP